jgi:hypothetical protein
VRFAIVDDAHARFRIERPAVAVLRVDVHRERDVAVLLDVRVDGIVRDLDGDETVRITQRQLRKIEVFDDRLEPLIAPGDAEPPGRKRRRTLDSANHRIVPAFCARSKPRSSAICASTERADCSASSAARSASAISSGVAGRRSRTRPDASVTVM